MDAVRALVRVAAGVLLVSAGPFRLFLVPVATGLPDHPPVSRDDGA